MSSSNSSNQGRRHSGQDDSQKSDYRWLKDQGFKDQFEFSAAYGEKPHNDAGHNGKVIMGAMRENDPGSAVGKWYREEKAKGQEPTLN